MMKNYWKFLLLPCGIFLVIAALIGCNPKNSQAAPTAEAQEDTKEIPAHSHLKDCYLSEEEFWESWKEAKGKPNEKLSLYAIDYRTEIKQAYRVPLELRQGSRRELVLDNRLAANTDYSFVMSLPSSLAKKDIVTTVFFSTELLPAGETTEICAVAKTAQGEAYVGKCIAHVAKDLYLSPSNYGMDRFGDKLILEFETSSIAPAMAENFQASYSSEDTSLHCICACSEDPDAAYDKFGVKVIDTTTEADVTATEIIPCSLQVNDLDSQEKLSRLSADQYIALTMKLPMAALHNDSHYDLFVDYASVATDGNWQAVIELEKDGQTIYKGEVNLPVEDTQNFCVGPVLHGDRSLWPEQNFVIGKDEIQVFLCTSFTEKMRSLTAGGNYWTDVNTNIYYNCKIQPLTDDFAEISRSGWCDYCEYDTCKCDEIEKRRKVQPKPKTDDTVIMEPTLTPPPTAKPTEEIPTERPATSETADPMATPPLWPDERPNDSF